MLKNKVSPIALGLSLGIVWGLSIFLMGLAAYFYQYGKPFVEAMNAMYLGYEPSVLTCVIGGVIGFVNAFIGGAVVGWLYNVFSGCCNKGK